MTYLSSIISILASTALCVLAGMPLLGTVFCALLMLAAQDRVTNDTGIVWYAASLVVFVGSIALSALMAKEGWHFTHCGALAFAAWINVLNAYLDRYA